MLIRKRSAIIIVVVDVVVVVVIDYEADFYEDVFNLVGNFGGLARSIFSQRCHQWPLL